MHQELHIFEEETPVFWGLAILVCTAGGTYLLSGTFVSMDWNLLNIQQIGALVLFLISFWGIFKLSEPKYHFAFHFESEILVIDIQKGTHLLKTLKLPAQEIDALRFSPEYPRLPKEALFDFSRSYHLMWRRKNEPSYQKVLSVESAQFTLKVDDIAKIMHFIQQRVPDIYIPPEQSDFFNL
ncbi:hypothetical protein [Fodinibius salsisoli]|uniref:PH domain-containing protein n=1 Tax=Fodinibius salsisoli TaxID=2820877 RepID=A0ABT3PMP6_9BACT|nr:hypothetical protein [Fodinibius salsisoli]MCW9707187.1 hypothetical protein [Fodinibius salsisoli]